LDLGIVVTGLPTSGLCGPSGLVLGLGGRAGGRRFEEFMVVSVFCSIRTGLGRGRGEI
jgi:hypothetical protein